MSTEPTAPTITDRLRQQLADSLPQATPEQVDELMALASDAGAAINAGRDVGGLSVGAVHYLAWPTSSTYLCDADAVGRRNTLRDTGPQNTTCPECLAHSFHPLS